MDRWRFQPGSQWTPDRRRRSMRGAFERGNTSGAPFPLPRQRGAAPMLAVEDVSVEGGDIDVHVLGACGEGAQVVGEALDGARVVGAEERTRLSGVDGA